MRISWLLLLAMFCVVSAGGALAGDFVIHSGNVLTIDKDKGTIEMELRNGGKKAFTVTDKDVLASPVWKKRLNVGDGVDIKADGDKVITVLRRNLPVTIRPAEAGAPK